MTKTDFSERKHLVKSIDEYHSTFPAEVRERLQQIRKTIKEAVPEAKEVISYQIPAFKYKGYLIYYAAYAKHISLSSRWSDAFLKEFEPELKKLKVTKSTIQLPYKDELPLGLIKRMVTFLKRENESESKKYRKTSGYDALLYVWSRIYPV